MANVSDDIQMTPLLEKAFSLTSKTKLSGKELAKRGKILGTGIGIGMLIFLGTLLAWGMGWSQTSGAKLFTLFIGLGSLGMVVYTTGIAFFMVVEGITAEAINKMHLQAELHEETERGSKLAAELAEVKERDVTERKKWEEERLRGAKLEAIGTLAEGIAHDFNNILTTILGQLSLAKNSLDPSNPIFNRIAEAEQASLRGQEFADQFLTFAKGEEDLEVKIFDSSKRVTWGNRPKASWETLLKGFNEYLTKEYLVEPGKDTLFISSDVEKEWGEMWNDINVKVDHLCRGISQREFLTADEEFTKFTIKPIIMEEQGEPIELASKLYLMASWFRMVSARESFKKPSVQKSVVRENK